MKYKFIITLLCLAPLTGMLAGCASHAPSAAMLMNSHKDKASVGLSAALGWGGSYNYSDGDINYKEEGMSAFEIPLIMRTEYFLVSASLEMPMALRVNLGFVCDYVGVLGWAAPFSVGEEHEAGYGGMLVEQYPITENIKIGLNEFFANNQYTGSEYLGEVGRSWYPKGYKEIGIGIYAIYKEFSFEFRYGNELNSANNRYRFMASYIHSFQI